MLPNDDKPWAKTVAFIVIGFTIVALVVLAFVLKAHNTLHIPEIVGIVPPNLAIVYPWLLPSNRVPPHGPGTKSTVP
jgi:hypothetical protein